MGKAPRVVTPALIGLSVPAAHDTALDAGLLAVLQHAAAADAVISAQYPLPGHRLRRGTHIRIWAQRTDDTDDEGGGPGGGGGGLVLPTGPRPSTPSGTKPR